MIGGGDFEQEPLNIQNIFRGPSYFEGNEDIQPDEEELEKLSPRNLVESNQII